MSEGIMDWQPVRIAPASFVWKHQELGFTDSHLFIWEAAQGKIVRVRPTFGVAVGCHGKCYDIHPEDEKIFFEDCPQILCEHQILAD